MNQRPTRAEPWQHNNLTARAALSVAGNNEWRNAELSGLRFRSLHVHLWQVDQRLCRQLLGKRVSTNVVGRMLVKDRSTNPSSSLDDSIITLTCCDRFFFDVTSRLVDRWQTGSDMSPWRMEDECETSMRAPYVDRYYEWFTNGVNRLRGLFGIWTFNLRLKWTTEFRPIVLIARLRNGSFFMASS